MSDGRDDVRARAGLHQRLVGEQLHRLVVEDAAVLAVTPSWPWAV
jgi:hypothetical protein